MKETFDSVNKTLSDACELALKKPIRRKQLVLMTYARFRSAENALMFEDHPNHKIQSKRKTYVWFENFLPRATQDVHILKKNFDNLHEIS